MQKAMESWHTGFNCQNDKEKRVNLDYRETEMNFGFSYVGLIYDDIVGQDIPDLWGYR